LFWSPTDEGCFRFETCDGRNLGQSALIHAILTMLVRRLFLAGSFAAENTRSVTASDGEPPGILMRKDYLHFRQKASRPDATSTLEAWPCTIRWDICGAMISATGESSTVKYSTANNVHYPSQRGMQARRCLLNKSSYSPHDMSLKQIHLPESTKRVTARTMDLGRER